MTEDSTQEKCPELELNTENDNVPVPKAHDINACPICTKPSQDPYLAFLRET